MKIRSIEGSGLSTNFDVIVVGGGPAGAAAAITCRRHGLRTLVLEASTNPGEQPGETLHPGVEPLFCSLGVDVRVNKARFLRHPGYMVRSGNKSTFVAYGSDHRGQWLGYQADRSILHGILLEHASAKGAVVVRGERAVRPTLLDNAVGGVETRVGAYTSRFVVDAAGPTQWLRRQLRIPSFRVSTLLVARFGWFEQRDNLEVESSMPEFCVSGYEWNWTAPVKASRYAWVNLNLMNERLANRLMPNGVAGQTPVSKLGASDVTWKIARPCAGPGYFMVGDAAWVLDPASSHGVLKAIMSGMIVADMIGRVLNDSGQIAHMQASYCAWAEDQFCADAAALISLYSGMEKPPTWLSAGSEAVRYIARSPSARAFSSNPTRA